MQRLSEPSRDVAEGHTRCPAMISRVTPRWLERRRPGRLCGPKPPHLWDMPAFACSAAVHTRCIPNKVADSTWCGIAQWGRGLASPRPVPPAAGQTVPPPLGCTPVAPGDSTATRFAGIKMSSVAAGAVYGTLRRAWSPIALRPFPLCGRLVRVGRREVRYFVPGSDRRRSRVWRGYGVFSLGHSRNSLHGRVV